MRLQVTPHVLARSVAAVGVLAGALLLTSSASATNSASATTGAVPSQSPTTTAATRVPGGAGKVAYVTPAGEVMVSNSDGSDPVVLGASAAKNAMGLSPLTWRQPSQDAVAYVRTDGALVVAPINGGPPAIVALDAVVPPQADEQILSYDLTGTFLVYLAQPSPGVVESRAIDFRTAVPTIATIGDARRRVVLSQRFSPLDPFLFQRTADAETGREFTTAVVEPAGGAIAGLPFSVSDPTFSPDGKYVFAVSEGLGSQQQLMRLRIYDLEPEGVIERDRICRPAVSPDATRVVFAAGPDCTEIWTVNTDGTDPKMLTDQVGGSATFSVGEFSWSLDGATVSHAACKGTDSSVICGGGYWDIDTTRGTARPRMVAGSVLHEQRTLIRPVKLKVTVTGSVQYTGVMKVGAKSVAPLVQRAPFELYDATAVDENDSRRTVTIKVFHPSDSVMVSGTITVSDGDFQQDFPFFGRILPLSYGYARLRGIWMRTSSAPFESGQIVATIER